MSSVFDVLNTIKVVLFQSVRKRGRFVLFLILVFRKLRTPNFIPLYYLSELLSTLVPLLYFYVSRFISVYVVTIWDPYYLRLKLHLFWLNSFRMIPKTVSFWGEIDILFIWLKFWHPLFLLTEELVNDELSLYSGWSLDPMSGWESCLLPRNIISDLCLS